LDSPFGDDSSLSRLDLLQAIRFQLGNIFNHELVSDHATRTQPRAQPPLSETVGLSRGFWVFFSGDTNTAWMLCPLGYILFLPSGEPRTPFEVSKLVASRRRPELEYSRLAIQREAGWCGLRFD
jgi:hypothetical protein